MSRIKDTSGSMMIAALIITLITGSLVGLYLKTVTQEVTSSYRARMAFQAVNLAEAGLEYAMHAMIEDSWSGWSSSNGGYYKDQFSEVNISYNNETREVKVWVDPDATPYPVAIAEGIITLGNGISVSKQVRVEITRGTSQDPTRGGYWGNGILGKQGLNFGGNKQTVDSFHSGDAPNGWTDINDIYDNQVVGTTILGHTLARGNGSVATNTVSLSSVSVGNTDIYGSLSTNASGSDIFTVIGPNGSIYNQESTLETVSGNVDEGFVAYDFFAFLPDVNTPTLDGASTELSGTVMGSTEAPSSYQLTGLNVRNNETITIEGKVKLFIDGDLTVKGTLEVASTATVELFVSGDIDVGGNGLVNNGLPENLRIYSTQSAEDAVANGASSIKLHGTAPVSAAVYAPNSDISLRGGGNAGAFFGAVVGNTVTFAGNNYEFHYDEALAELTSEEDTTDGTLIPEVYSWTELTEASEKVNLASYTSETP